MIFKNDIKIDLKKVEAVFVSYVKGFGDRKYRRFDDLQICKYYVTSSSPKTGFHVHVCVIVIGNPRYSLEI